MKKFSFAWIPFLFVILLLGCLFDFSQSRCVIADDLGTFETSAPFITSKTEQESFPLSPVKTSGNLRDLVHGYIIPTTPPQDEVASAPSGVVCEGGVCRIVQRPVPDAISTRSSTYYRATVCSGRFRYLGRAVVGNTFCVGRCVLSRIFRR